MRISAINNMINVHTPTRIDLAGGTLDLKPLFQFVYPDIYATINIAINLYNHVEITQLPSTKIVIKSVDLGQTAEFSDINDLKNKIKDINQPLLMIMRAVYYFEMQGINIEMSSQAPKGSGLGNSSSLLIAVVGALNVCSSKNYSKETLIDIAQGIETSILKIPTGSQDYIAAMYGGMNKIEYNLTRHEVKKLKLGFIGKKILENCLLCYIEEPKRYSSAIENPNWDIFKRVVEEPLELFDQLGDINQVVNRMTEAIENEDWELFITSIRNETSIRSKLSDSIVSSKMARLIELLKNRDNEAYKICGAGGGGCVLIFSESIDEIKKELTSKDYQILDFSIDDTGFQIVNNN
jgi:D-glycero-alpha-D-manno-heptose-7-phosphate kinase